VYHSETDPFCPVFRLGDIVEEAGENYAEVAVKVRCINSFADVEV
jgi:hypothetical protein